MLFDAAAGRAAVGSVSAGTAACVTAIRGEGSDSTDGTTLKGLATETGTISRRAAIPQSTSRQRFGAFARIRRSARITRISMLVGILIRMSRKNRSVMVFIICCISLISAGDSFCCLENAATKAGSDPSNVFSISSSSSAACTSAFETSDRTTHCLFSRTPRSAKRLMTV